jgi:hypothetical protein
MTTRTVQVLGWAFSNSTVTMTAVWDGNTVFNGTVSTSGDTYPGNDVKIGLTIPDRVLFTFEIPMETTGNVPVTLTTQGGTVLLEDFSANYSTVKGSPWKYEFCGINNGLESRSNISIDGIPYTMSPDINEENGNSSQTILLGTDSTISFDVAVASAGSV